MCSEKIMQSFASNVPTQASTVSFTVSYSFFKTSCTDTALFHSSLHNQWRPRFKLSSTTNFSPRETVVRQIQLADPPWVNHFVYILQTSCRLEQSLHSTWPTTNALPVLKITIFRESSSHIPALCSCGLPLLKCNTSPLKRFLWFFYPQSFNHDINFLVCWTTAISWRACWTMFQTAMRYRIYGHQALALAQVDRPGSFPSYHRIRNDNVSSSAKIAPAKRFKMQQHLRNTCIQQLILYATIHAHSLALRVNNVFRTDVDYRGIQYIWCCLRLSW